MKIVRDVLSLALVASGLVGTQILLSDKWLWSAAPSHAFGLVGFVLIDLVLVAATLRRIGIAALGATLLASVQFGAMLSDLVAGQPEGVPSVAFRNYLLSDAAYLGLLFIQVAIVIVAVDALATSLFHRHGRVLKVLHFQHQ